VPPTRPIFSDEQDQKQLKGYVDAQVSQFSIEASSRDDRSREILSAQKSQRS
jgi:hypothetical protein